MKSVALKKLNSNCDPSERADLLPTHQPCVVDVFWHEIARKLETIKQLCEDPNFQDRKLAALIVSKVCFYLKSYDDAVLFALRAEDKLDVREGSEYVKTMIANCFKDYIAKRQSRKTTFDPRQKSIVDRIFQKYFDDGEFKQTMHLAIETRRTDMFTSSINLSVNVKIN